jgi:phage recombination protein Bet
MTALALRDDQTEWDAQQIAVLEANGIDKDVSDAELAAFLHECQRRKLDPFSRQIYLIGRKDKSKGRKVYRSQTSIDGFRLIARRAADKSGIDYSYEDTIWFDDKGGRHEVWLSPGLPAAAKVVVVRNGCRFDAVARFSAYVQTDWNGNPTRMWLSMPDVMVAKCAEALALRKAFPEDLGGIYPEEEMAQADNPQRVQAVSVEVVREDAAPSPEREWLAAALTAAPNHASLDACAVVWRKSAELVREGKLTKAEAGGLQDILRRRMEELKNAPPAEAGEVVDAEIVEDETLDPDDPWAVAIEGLAVPEDAEKMLEDLIDQRGRGNVDPERAARIERAIEARFPQTATEAQAA